MSLNKWSFILVAFSFFLVSCGGENKISGVFEKEGVALPYSTMENSPVLFQGRLIVVSSERLDAHGTRILVRDYASSATITSVDTPNFGLVSAMIFNDTVYVVGSTDWSVDSTGKSTKDNNYLRIMSSTDLITWSSPTVIYEAPVGVALFNTSITYDGSRFIVAYEVKNSSNTGFDTLFLSSPDLVSWSKVGGSFDDSRYSACPTIRFSSGYYYMFYLSIVDGKYQTMISRTRDLISWEHASRTDFIPALDEGVNNSDVDFSEKDGRTYFIYATGDQQTWLETRRAEYTGTFSEYVNSFQYSAVRP